MADKIRTMVLLTEETHTSLQESVPANMRSTYIEDLIRKDLGLVTLKGRVPGYATYERSIDDGAGLQIVCANDGIITSQHLSAKPGLYHSYTGGGNPEWIGHPTQVIYGKGFKRIRRIRP